MKNITEQQAKNSKVKFQAETEGRGRNHTMKKEKQTIGERARESMSQIEAGQDAINLIIRRHFKEYKAIFNKRLQIRRKLNKKELEK